MAKNFLLLMTCLSFTTSSSSPWTSGAANAAAVGGLVKGNTSGMTKIGTELPQRDQALPEKFATEPSHQSTVVGSTAVLPCRVINRPKPGMVQWTRDGFGLGTERNLIGFET